MVVDRPCAVREGMGNTVGYDTVMEDDSSLAVVGSSRTVGPGLDLGLVANHGEEGTDNGALAALEDKGGDLGRRQLLAVAAQVDMAKKTTLDLE